MQTFGRAIAAFTIWAAAAAALAQTPPAAPPATDDSAATAPTVDEPAAGDPIVDESGGGTAGTGEPVGGEPVVGGPITDPSTIVTPATVAPMPVTPVTVAPTAPTPPVVAAPAGPPPIVAVPEAVYVTNFIAVPADAPPSGLLARLRAALHTHSARHDAGLVAQAVVQRLNHAGVAARYLAPDEPPPVQGWLISGVFRLQGGPGTKAPDSQAAATDGVGAQVSVTVADLEHSADTPFALIGAPPAASSEADPWHPYVVPAQLSFERADRNAAVAALAQQIADTFVGNMTALRQADARAISR